MQRVFGYYRGTIVGKIRTSTVQLFAIDGAIWIHRKWDNKAIQFWIHEIFSRYNKGLGNSIHCPHSIMAKVNEKSDWPTILKHHCWSQTFDFGTNKCLFCGGLPQFCGNVLLNLKSGICLTWEVESFSGFWVVISLIIQPVFAFQHPSIC